MAEIMVRRSPKRSVALMEPVHYHPLDLLDEIERFASEAWDSWTPMIGPSGLLADMDVYEEKDELVVRMELPGIKKEDIDISVSGDMLTVKAEKSEEQEKTEGRTYYRSERCFGEYTRSIRLPFPVSAEKVNAHFEGGLLDIRLPKAQKARAKKIEVKAK